MNEFFKIENFLLTWDVNDQKLYNYVSQPLKHESLNRLELEYFYNPLQNNLELLERISNTLHDQYFCRIPYSTTKNNEIITVVELYKTIQQLTFIKLPTKCLADLFAFWFIRALSDIDVKNSELTDKKLWKSRYDVIANIMHTLRQFTTQLEFFLKIKIPLVPDTKNVIFVLLHCLTNNNILEVKTTTTQNKSEKYVALLSSNPLKPSIPNLGLHTTPRRISAVNGDLVYIGLHYSDIKQVVHKNKASWNTPQITNLEFLEKRSNLKLFINWRLMDSFKKIILKNFKLEPNTTETDFLLYLGTLKLNFWQKNKQKEFSNLFFIKYVYALEKCKQQLEDGFFFTYYFDFRGRIYTDSPLGYTHNKFFRYIYYYGFYKKEEIVKWEKNNEKTSWKRFEKIIKESSLVKDFPNIDYTKNLNKYYITTVFFEIGKLFKSKFIDAYNGSLSQEDFIQIGIECYNRRHDFSSELTTQLEFKTLTHIIHDLDNQIYRKIPIFKDATASAIQILMLLLGSENLQNYVICNLSDETRWYDTYYYIIKRFFDTHTIPEEWGLKYFTRRNLKKTIMTYNYEASYRTCWQDFAKNAEINFTCDPTLAKNIEKNFRLFYQYLITIFEKKEFFLMPSEEILNIFKKQWTIDQKLKFITNDEVVLYYDYCKIIKQRLDRIINNQRESIQWSVKTEEPDTSKMFRALRANLIHSFDGFLVRVITLQLEQPIITIHDSFGIDILNIESLQKIAQTELQKIFEEDFFKLRLEKPVLVVRSPYIFL